jgi:hypothetical protein
MLTWITKLIPAPYLYLGLALAFAAMAGWTWIAQARMEAAQANARAEKTRADGEKTRADTNTAAYLSLATLTKKQNDEIEALKVEGEKRAAVAEAAAQESRHAAIPHLDRSAYYLGLKAPQSGVCDATKELIDGYSKVRALAAAGSVRH